MKITTMSSSRSFFVKLSEETQSSIHLYVYRYQREPLYLAIAHVPKAISPEKIKQSYQGEKSKFIKIERYLGLNGAYMLALKERCEFYELLEDYNVSISTPYTIRSGRRTFCIYGLESDLEKYIDNLKAFYGEKSVLVEKTTPSRCIQQHVKDTVHVYMLSHLTNREKEVLVKAYDSGYLSSRRRAKLDELAEQLNVSKSTASLMVRKAIEKIVGKLLET